MSELSALNRPRSLNCLFFAVGLFISGLIFSNDQKLQECTFSKVPILGNHFKCRQSSISEILSLEKYWKSEDDAEICHYFYFPLSDPTATKELLLENYLIMHNELQFRKVDCIKDHRNIFWYRGKRTKSMLEKLIYKYNLDLKSD